MVARITVAVLLFLKVLGNVSLEMFELTLGNKHISEGMLTFVAHAEQFDLLAAVLTPFVSQALKCQFDIGLTYKLNL
ncbi:hypothetical protein SZ30_31760 [Burkholderia pseudomallei]|nr:hypothetical protein SZ30_31760 [Burkholderia pseudomallei]